MSKVKKYTPEFKQEASKLAIESGNVNGTAKGLGMPGATLHTWVSQLQDLTLRDPNW